MYNFRIVSFCSVRSISNHSSSAIRTDLTVTVSLSPPSMIRWTLSRTLSKATLGIFHSTSGLYDRCPCCCCCCCCCCGRTKGGVTYICCHCTYRQGTTQRKIQRNRHRRSRRTCQGKPCEERTSQERHSSPRSYKE